MGGPGVLVSARVAGGQNVGDSLERSCIAVALLRKGLQGDICPAATTLAHLHRIRTGVLSETLRVRARGRACARRSCNVAVGSSSAQGAVLVELSSSRGRR